MWSILKTFLSKWEKLSHWRTQLKDQNYSTDLFWDNWLQMIKNWFTQGNQRHLLFADSCSVSPHRPEFFGNSSFSTLQGVLDLQWQLGPKIQSLSNAVIMCDIMWLHCSATATPGNRCYCCCEHLFKTLYWLPTTYRKMGKPAGSCKSQAAHKQASGQINGCCPVAEEARGSWVAGEMWHEYEAQRGCTTLQEWWGRCSASAAGLGVTAAGWEQCANVWRDSASVKLGKAA